MDCGGQITLSKIDEICTLAIQNQIFSISMHIPSLVKIHWYLLKLSSRNEKSDMSQADKSVKTWQNLPISNFKPDLHNINWYIKFGENPLINTCYRPETKIRTDGTTDDQCETIIPCHYHVAGYKKMNDPMIVTLVYPITTCVSP